MLESRPPGPLRAVSLKARQSRSPWVPSPRSIRATGVPGRPHPPETEYCPLAPPPHPRPAEETPSPPPLRTVRPRRALPHQSLDESAPVYSARRAHNCAGTHPQWRQLEKSNSARGKRVPRAGSAVQAAAPSAATTGKGKGGREKRPVRAVPRNKTCVDWLGLVYASWGLADVCPEGLAWQHLSCGLARDSFGNLTLRAFGPPQAGGGETQQLRALSQQWWWKRPFQSQLSPRWKRQLQTWNSGSTRVEREPWRLGRMPRAAGHHAAEA